MMDIDKTSANNNNLQSVGTYYRIGGNCKFTVQNFSVLNLIVRVVPNESVEFVK